MGKPDRSPDRLWLSRDRKVGPRGYWQDPWRNKPGRWIPSVGAAFGLPSGVSCPGRTSFCDSCYGARSENSPGVAPLLAHNLQLLTEAATVENMAALLDDLVDTYTVEADNADVDDDDRMFRIHWDGDFYSTDYAEAWCRTIEDHPDVRFWAYTRSFRAPVDVVEILVDLPNLALYLSVDTDNHAAAQLQLDRWPRLRAAWCAVDYKTGHRMSVLRHQKAIPCPENAGRMPLMADGRGACLDCRLCPDGRRDVIFSTSHRLDVNQPVRLIRKEVGPTQRAAETFTCGWAPCSTTFTREPGARGRKPTYCSRTCQVKAYQASLKAPGHGPSRHTDPIPFEVTSDSG